MHSFKDLSGKSWTLELTIGVARKIKSQLKIDLFESEAQSLIDTLWQSPLRRLEMMELMLVESVKTEDFEAALTGQTFELANDAFWEELNAFIQSLRPEVATILQATMSKAKLLSQRQTEMIQRMVNSPEVMQKIDQQMEKIEKEANQNLQNLLGSASTSLPES